MHLQWSFWGLHFAKTNTHIQIKTYKSKKNSKITSENGKTERWKPEDKNREEDAERQRETYRTRQTITRGKENNGEEYGRERATVVKRRERESECVNRV